MATLSVSRTIITCDNPDCDKSYTKIPDTAAPRGWKQITMTLASPLTSTDGETVTIESFSQVADLCGRTHVNTFIDAHISVA